jgi:hypothetical protein
LLVGSYWPDSKVYRFAPDGTQVTRDGWPRPCQAKLLANLGDEVWAVSEGGAAQRLRLGQERAAADPTFGGAGTMYASGLARDAEGCYWLAGSQGLVRFDRRGQPLGQRLGGLDGVRALSIAPDGTVIAALEKGQLMARLALDDEPGGPLANNANEPWRVGAGWQDRAAALAWDAGRFLVADEVGKQLWQFDPWHTGYQEKPWVKLTEPGSVTQPAAVAVGDLKFWLLADGKLREYRRPDLTAKDLPLPADFQPLALAAADDATLYLASADRVQAWRDGKLAWTAGGFKSIAGLAAASDGVLVSDREARRLVWLRDGKEIGDLALPGWRPGAVAARGGWAVVADEDGHRLVRVRVRS